MNGRFFAEFCSSSAGIAGANAHSQGTTRMRINTSIARSLPIPVPPIAEQAMIADRAQRFREVTREALERIATQLYLLVEYREALITAAVTGEIDVDTFDGDLNLEAATR